MTELTNALCHALARAVVMVAAAVALPAVALRLEPVVAGVEAPLYLTHAGDGSGRLYVVERGGRVRVITAGQAQPGVFLDIGQRVLAGGERGLLGLAFHRGYASNGRLFVFYTRPGDGALVIAEYARSPDPLRASDQEKVLLVIPHPGQSNHNGGMLAFGPDGYLYIGTGDGGGGNDPSNNAQNPDSLLGKILRIDVDRGDAAAGREYSIPPGNPFLGTAGRDEVFALGMRNPWRFSFDRASGALWVADVGQGAREEVNAPVVAGGNYGWRVLEGTQCTGLGPSPCDAAGFVPPRFDYTHEGSRCSITGGHVYRGSRNTLAAGTYVYGDFCSGEILAWDGGVQRQVAQTALSLASFGEDEAGELYAVDLGGGVYRLASDTLLAVEYRHAGFGHYFSTALPAEVLALDAGAFAGWSRTGESFAVLPAGTPGGRDVCRHFTTSFAPRSSHFYSPYPEECAALAAGNVWQAEGIVHAIRPTGEEGACAAGELPLYRLYNAGQGGAPNHRYTTSSATRAAMIAQGWVPEGVGPGVIGCVPAS